MSPNQLVSDFIANNQQFIYWLSHRISWSLKRRSATPLELEDISQDLVLTLLEHAHQYRPDDGAITTWAEWRARAMVSRGRSLKRQDKLIQGPEQDDEWGTWEENIPGREQDPAEVVTRQDCLAHARETIENRMALLTAPQAWAINGHFLDGHSKQELANKRSITDQSVRETIKYGKRRLARCQELRGVAKLLGVV